MSYLHEDGRHTVYCMYGRATRQTADQKIVVPSALWRSDRKLHCYEWRDDNLKVSHLQHSFEVSME
jgi:hypothetical protein